ncbi:MAG: NAD(+) synthase, partial [Clostridia bacterium]|nr:NAD(+) synthase [Clostridia bacterium]
MEHGFIKVKAVTPKLAVADTNFNVKNIINEIEKANAEGVNLLVFPQLSVCGYTAGDLIKSEQIKNSTNNALYQIISATINVETLVFVGAPVYALGKIFNCAIAVKNGKVLAVIPKTYLADDSGKSESRIFSPAPEFSEEIVLCDQRVILSNRVVLTAENMPEFSVCAELCEDMLAPISPATYCVMAGAKIVVNLASFYRTVSSIDRIKKAVENNSERLNCGYVLSNSGQGESTTDFVYTSSNIIAQNGKVLYCCDNFNADSVIGEIDAQTCGVESNADREVKRVFFSVKKRPIKLTYTYDKNPFYLTDGECETALKIQSYGLIKRLKHTKISKVVIGVSGGLDSTLALLALECAFKEIGLDSKNIIAVSMPCFGTSKRTKSNAEKLIGLIGATYRKINISKAVKRHFIDIGHDGETPDATFENSQARERTQVLMDIANTENALVIGTGDLSELALGWAT